MTNNKRLEKLEEAIRNRPDTGDLIDVTDDFYRILDEVYGPDADDRQPRERILVSETYLKNLGMTYGDLPWRLGGNTNPRLSESTGDEDTLELD